MNAIRPANLISKEVLAYNHSSWLRDGTTQFFIEKLEKEVELKINEAEALACSSLSDTTLLRVRLIEAHTIKAIIKQFQKEPDKI